MKGRQLAPGMLARHYSPRTPLVLRSPRGRRPDNVAGIFLRKPAGRTGRDIYWLSERGALAEVARNLYRVLRAADQGGHRQIWAEPLPAAAGGLAVALHDRLQRAAAKA
ncbi:MAG: Sua5 family C-terminal domain-containing protein [bacterium]|nr:Sua5 family C-terminal domain-containing protein [bacterium]